LNTTENIEEKKNLKSMRTRTLYQFLGSVLLALCSLMTACNSNKVNQDKPHSDHEEAAAGEWKEMDDFHEVMAESFHPFADSANLEPAKANAVAMAESAQRWKAAPLPERVDNNEMKQKLDELAKGAEAFKTTVATNDTTGIAGSLKNLHDLFHEIQEKWYGKSGEHHH
jgi:hypothetical protein